MLDDGTEIELFNFNSAEVYAEEAQRVFLKNAKRAAEQIVEIATKRSTDKVRLDASRYIVDRALGRVVGPDPNGAGKDDPWKDLMGSITREPSAAERAAGHQPYRD